MTQAFQRRVVRTSPSSPGCNGRSLAAVIGSRLLDVSTREGDCLRAASWGGAGSVRAHQKGCDFQRLHGRNFLRRTNWLGNWLDVEFFLSEAARMDQREFPLMGRMDAPSAVPFQWVRQCKTYRQAVRVAWKLRRVQYMTKAQLAAEADLYAQHVTDYLAEDDKPKRRDLPADAVARFESVVGNTLVSQWLAAQSKLTVLEELQASRVAA